jgi:hypothetical protein
MASTAPVLGSSATTAPLRPPSAASAASWVARSRVSTSVPPGVSRAVSRSVTFWPNCSGARPSRNELNSCSARVRPKTSE